MKKFLIAIDYHPSSEKVAKAGYQLAKLVDAEICLIHVMADITHYSMQYPSFVGYERFDTRAVDIEAENIERFVEDYLQSFTKHFNDPVVCTHLARGKAGKAILDYAEDWNADVVVMGTHSHSTLEKAFVGTIASKVIEKTKKPLYMVPVKKEV